MRSFFIFLTVALTILLGSELAAQTIRLKCVDNLTRTPITFDSIVVERMSDGMTWTTTTSEVVLNTTPVEEDANPPIDIRYDGSDIYVHSEAPVQGMQLYAMSGDQQEMDHVPPGVYALRLAIGDRSVTQLLSLTAPCRIQLEGTSKNGTGRILATDDFTMTIHRWKYKSKTLIKDVDVSKAQTLEVRVPRPSWASDVQRVTIHPGGSTGPSIDSALYKGKVKGNLTHVWSFTRDQDSYELWDDGMSGHVVYMVGPETSDKSEIGILLEAWFVTKAYTFTLEPTPQFVGNTVVFKCDGSYRIRYYEFEQQTGDEYENTDCDDRSVIFTLN